MKSVFILSIALVAGLSVPRQGLPAQKIPVDGVAALVNTNSITIGEVMMIVQSMQRQLMSKYTGAELNSQMQAAYSNALNNLIDQRLILDVYGKQEQKIPDSYLNQRVEEIMQDVFSGSRAEFMAALSKDKINYDDWKKEMRDRVLASVMRQMNVERNMTISCVAVRRLYDANLARYRTAPEIKLRMIAISNDDAGKKKAEEALKKLQGGADFAETAKAVSEDIKAAEGGDRGWMQPDALRPELAGRAVAMKKGETSGVIETSNQLYIIKVEDVKDAAVIPYTKAVTQIERELRKSEGEKMYAAWIGRLRKNAFVKVFETD